MEFLGPTCQPALSYVDNWMVEIRLERVQRPYVEVFAGNNLHPYTYSGLFTEGTYNKTEMENHHIAYMGYGAARGIKVPAGYVAVVNSGWYNEDKYRRFIGPISDDMTNDNSQARNWSGNICSMIVA